MVASNIGPGDIHYNIVHCEYRQVLVYCETLSS